MPPGTPPRRFTGALSLVALACACALAPASAWGAASRPGDGDLSPRLAELAKPAVRSAPPGKQADALSVATQGPGSLVREGNRVLVEVRFDRGAAVGAGDLRAAGAKVLNVSPRYQTVTVAAKASELGALSSVPRVANVNEVLAPIVHGAGDPGPVSAAAVPCFGGATSEGDAQLRANLARAEFEIDGSGVEVGILSDSFDTDGGTERHQAEDVANGDLPGAGNPCGQTTPVTILEDLETPNASDEGRAMAQIVHDLAPGASLAFATAVKGDVVFAKSIEDLRDGGADVIVDDVAYFNEPFFQEGPISVAVSNVAASGVSYFSSAGNNNLKAGGKDIASWEAPQFRDSLGCPEELEVLGFETSHCMDFDPEEGAGHSDDTFGITVKEGADLTVDVQWGEPWYGVEADLDALLLDSDGAPLVEKLAGKSFLVGSTDDNVDDVPAEIFTWTNDGPERVVQLALNRCAGICNPAASGAVTPRVKIALLQNGGGVSSTEYHEDLEGDIVGPTIFGHNGASDAVSTGAIRYNGGAAPEAFSSRGPVTHYFAPVVGKTPATSLGSPTVLEKPDIVATDGGANTFFGSCATGVWRFFGTSAAAPHAAAVAALEREAKPEASASDVKEAQLEGAAEVGVFGPDAVGAGMIDAVAALEWLGVASAAPGALPESPPTPFACEAEEPEAEPDPRIDEIENQIIAANPAAPTQAASNDFRDRLAPRTAFRRKPPRVLRTPWRWGRAVFRFRSNEPRVAFLCQFDRKRYRSCGQRFVRWFRVGRHVLRVRARDAADNVDRTPAVYRFRVKRVSHRAYRRHRGA